jgi:cytosine deaminase
MNPPTTNNPIPLRWIRSALTVHGALVDAQLDAATGRVVAVTPADATRAAADDPGALADELDLQGMLVLPAAAEPHTHLDKALSFDTIRPEYGGLAAGIAAWQAHARTIDEDDYVDRAYRAATELLSNGVTAIRTHAEVFGSDDPLVAVRALVRVREALSDVMTIQIAVLAKPEVPDDTLERAIAVGADLMGGSPHSAPDPHGFLARLVAIARRCGVGIDIHADERLDPEMLTVAQLAATHEAHPLPGTVTAGHCVSLGLVAAERLEPIIDLIVRSGVGVVTCPLTNLYLQGRDRPVATPRGLTAVRALLARGAMLAAGGDNIRDPLNPLGAADALATAGLLVAAGHVTIDEAFDAVTVGAREVMGLEAAGLAPGSVADLTAVRAQSLPEAVARAQHDRIVISRARIVSVRSSSLDRRIGGPPASAGRGL